MALWRLQKIIARSGKASLRGAEKLIASGRVKVDGLTVTTLGTKADPQKNKILVDGLQIEPLRQKFYYLLNKPLGYLTTKYDPRGRPTIMDFLKQIGLPLNPVGRLDFDTEGLILLTNDGDLTFKLTHPKFEIEKEYLVGVQGELGHQVLERLAAGVELEDGWAYPAEVEKISSGRFRLIIHEGRKRQIRRMCAAVGLEVVYLKRIRLGPLVLGDLLPGTWRPLSQNEVETLTEYVKKKIDDVRKQFKSGQKRRGGAAGLPDCGQSFFKSSGAAYQDSA